MLITKKELLKVRNDLGMELDNILTYWMDNAQDDQYGGFYGKINHFNKVIPGQSKGSVLNSRILWTFSTAFNQLQKRQYFLLATRAFDYIENHFIDKDHGGLIWEVAFNGRPLDTRKHIYAQAFGIYGLSAYYQAGGGEASLGLAKQLFDLIERFAFDREHGGYIECLSQDWKPLEDMRLSDKDENLPKSMNTHLHVLEAYCGLYRVWKDECLENRISLLVRNFLDQILNEKKRHFSLFFSMDWKAQSSKISFGHDIEGAWLLTEAVNLLDDRRLREEVEDTALSIAEATISQGMDKDGSIFNELDPSKDQLDTDKHWWPQAEAMVGMMNAYEISGDEKYLTKCIDIWTFIKSSMVDRDHGEWYWRVDKEGRPYEQEDKAGFWKCPYHNSRACAEVIRRIDRLIQ